MNIFVGRTLKPAELELSWLKLIFKFSNISMFGWATVITIWQQVQLLEKNPLYTPSQLLVTLLLSGHVILKNLHISKNGEATVIKFGVE